MSQELESQAISAKMRPTTREIYVGFSSLLWTRTWFEAAKPIRNSDATRTIESEMAAKMVAVVVPRRTAMRAWMTAKREEERGLMKMSQTA